MPDMSTREVDRALDAKSNPSRVAEDAAREKRYIYNGDPPASTSGYVIRPNKRGTHRKISTFNIIVTLFAAGGLIVLCVNNIVTVNQLAGEVGKLQAQHEECLNTITLLRAEVEQKSSRERIERIATEQLGLSSPREQPIWFNVDPDALETLQGK